MAGIGNIRLGLRQKIPLICALASLLTLSLVFYYLDRYQVSTYLESIKSQSNMLFRQIVLTRKWIADHGGVFVEQLPWVTENPYLKNSTLKLNGKKYVKKNPAMITRELSEYSTKQHLYSFHITSLRPINPANSPDEFETRSMRGFDAKDYEEAWEVATTDGQRFFRYIAPLYTEAACLECHFQHGYKLGDVRGAISISIPIEPFFAAHKKERIIMASIAVAAALIMMLGLYVALNNVVVNPIRRLRDVVTEWGNDVGIDKNSALPAPLECPKVAGLKDGDELNDLYKEFCRLHFAIKQHQRQLEGSIESKTAELSRANEQLALARDRYRETSRRKSEFIAGLSHELRTPLTSIKGAVGYIADRLEMADDGRVPSKEELMPFADIINRNINRFIKLMEDTLDLEKIEAGHMSFDFTYTDIANILEEAVEEFGPFAEEKGLKIELNMEKLPLIYADEGRIRQVMDNFIKNAVRHSPFGAKIKIEGYLSGDMAIVTVKDQGPGIPYEKQKKVFERFYRDSKEGTGLGLTISEGIIMGHGGEIGVHSDGMSGSTFYFKLPANRKPDEALAEGEPQTEPDKPAHFRRN